MKILIADDHRLIVEAIADKLGQLAPGARIESVLTVADMLARLDNTFDLALIDLGMPGAQGVAHVALVHRRWPALPIIVISGTDDAESVRAAMAAGASGFVPKTYSPTAMLGAVRDVLAGGIHLPPTSTEESAASTLFMRNRPLPPPRAVLRERLTERQFDVLRQLIDGHANKEIARALGISEGTVKIHLAAVFRELRARNRTEAVIAARAMMAAEA